MMMRVLFCCVPAFMLLSAVHENVAAQGLRERLEARRAERQDTGADKARGGKLREKLAGRTSGHDEPAGLPDGARVLRDIPYGAHEKQKIDVYLPPDAVQAPVIFMVHGGAWMTGDKANKGVVGNKAAYWMPKGYAFVSVNYRMVPDGIDPYAQAIDVAVALSYVQQHAAEWGMDAHRIVTMGQFGRGASCWPTRGQSGDSFQRRGKTMARHGDAG